MQGTVRAQAPVCQSDCTEGSFLQELEPLQDQIFQSYWEAKKLFELKNGTPRFTPASPVIHSVTMALLGKYKDPGNSQYVSAESEYRFYLNMTLLAASVLDQAVKDATELQRQIRGPSQSELKDINGRLATVAKALEELQEFRNDLANKIHTARKALLEEPCALEKTYNILSVGGSPISNVAFQPLQEAQKVSIKTYLWDLRDFDQQKPTRQMSALPGLEALLKYQKDTAPPYKRIIFSPSKDAKNRELRLENDSSNSKGKEISDELLNAINKKASQSKEEIRKLRSALGSNSANKTSEEVQSGSGQKLSRSRLTDEALRQYQAAVKNVLAMFSARSKAIERKSNGPKVKSEEDKIADPTTEKTLNREEKKILLRSPNETIQIATDFLKEFKRNNSPQFSWNTHFLETELNDPITSGSQEQYERTTKIWKDTMDRYRSILKSHPELDGDKKIDWVISRLYEDFYKNFCSQKARLNDILTERCGNCESQTKLIISAFKDLGIDVGEGRVLAAQLFRDHIQPVIYDKAKDQIWDLKSGDTIQGVEAPLYEPELLVHGYAKKRGATPYPASHLLIADMDPKFKNNNPSKVPPTNSSLEFPNVPAIFYPETPPKNAVMQKPHAHTNITLVDAGKENSGNQIFDPLAGQNDTRNGTDSSQSTPHNRNKMSDRLDGPTHAGPINPLIGDGKTLKRSKDQKTISTSTRVKTEGETSNRKTHETNGAYKAPTGPNGKMEGGESHLTNGDSDKADTNKSNNEEFGNQSPELATEEHAPYRKSRLREGEIEGGETKSLPFRQELQIYRNYLHGQYGYSLEDLNDIGTNVFEPASRDFERSRFMRISILFSMNKSTLLVAFRNKSDLEKYNSPSLSESERIEFINSMVTQSFEDLFTTDLSIKVQEGFKNPIKILADPVQFEKDRQALFSEFQNISSKGINNFTGPGVKSDLENRDASKGYQEFKKAEAAFYGQVAKNPKSFISLLNNPTFNEQQHRSLLAGVLMNGDLVSRHNTEKNIPEKTSSKVTAHQQALIRTLAESSLTYFSDSLGQKKEDEKIKKTGIIVPLVKNPDDPRPSQVKSSSVRGQDEKDQAAKASEPGKKEIIIPPEPADAKALQMTLRKRLQIYEQCAAFASSISAAKDCLNKWSLPFTVAIYNSGLINNLNDTSEISELLSTLKEVSQVQCSGNRENTCSKVGLRIAVPSSIAELIFLTAKHAIDLSKKNTNFSLKEIGLESLFNSAPRDVGELDAAHVTYKKSLQVK